MAIFYCPCEDHFLLVDQITSIIKTENAQYYTQYLIDSINPHDIWKSWNFSKHELTRQRTLINLRAI